MAFTSDLPLSSFTTEIDILTTPPGRPVRPYIPPPLIYRVAQEMYSKSTIVAFSIGGLGNMLSLAILSRKSQRKSNTSIFLRALAVADFITIWAYFMQMYGVVYNANINSPTLCKIIIFLQSSCQMISSYLIIVVSLERFFAVMFPLKVGRIFTRKLAITVTVLVFVIFLLINTPYFIFVELRPRSNVCGIDRSSNVHKIWKKIDTVIAVYIPLCTIFILNIMIIVQLKKSGKKQKKMQNNQENKRQDQSGQITRMLVALTISYIILNTPMAVNFAGADEFFDLTTPQGYSNAYLMQTVSIFMLLLNSSINFYLYVLTGKRFRDEFLMMFGCKKPEANKTTMMTSKKTVSTTMISDKVPMDNRA